MKLTPLTLAMLSAFSAASMAPVQATTTPATAAKVQPMQLPSAESRTSLQKGKQARQLAVRDQGGKNLTLNRRAPADKYVAEANLSGKHSYIVELFGDAVVSQQLQQASSSGKTTVAGMALQSPTAAAQAYKIEQQQDKVLNDIASTLGRTIETSARYNTVFNGFSTELTQDEVRELANLGSVKKITRVKTYQLQTDEGPQHIGADKVWTGETSSGGAFKGEGMVVGIVDTGINTDHPSFQATGGDGYSVVNPLGSGNYLGDCRSAEFASRCNDKLIGVYSYKKITDSYKADEFQDPNKPWWEPNLVIRPAFGEDYNGHGSHTASTAAGNVLTNVPLQSSSGAQGDGVNTGFNFAKISGVAPHANIVAFQVCWPGGSGDAWAGCPGDVLVQAIEDAVKAGVDVINFSIGGSEDSPWESPLEQAFLAAHAAGINVAVAAGNSGTDGNGELMGYADHSSPWLMNVAAATHGRSIDITGKTLSNFSGGDSTPETITGASISGEVTGPVVNAADFGDAQCLNSFAENTFTHGEIVLCQRGTNGRVAKAENVKAGGAAGFILYNTDYDSSTATGMTFNDVYPLPGIHVDAAAGYTLQQWLASGANHSATITAATIERSVNAANADKLANFSSRGPSTYAKEHLIPMVSAPGVDIFAANSDDQPFSGAPNSSDFTMMSGTSMASPHVAGALTLVKQAHPEWSPAEVQSALQMTSLQTLKFKPNSWSDEQDAGIYRGGSGRIDVQRAVNAGLVMHETEDNFRAADPANGGAVRQLNMPELVNMQCRESCTWVRTFTATRDGDWKVETETGEVSFTIEATPQRFSLKKGEQQTVVFKANILDSQSNSHNSEQEVHGAVRLTADQPNLPAVFMPVAVKYSHGSLPENLPVTINRNDGKHQFNGWALPELKSGTYSAASPVKADTRLVTLPQDVDFCGFACDHVISDSEDVQLIDVPANTDRLIVEVLKRTASTAEKDEPWNAGDADVYIGMDLNGDGIPQWDEEAICMSISEEVGDYCNINKPAAGKYWVVVHNFIHGTLTRVSDTYQVATAIVPAQSSNALSVQGPAVHDGMTPATVALHWNLPEARQGDVYYSMLHIGTSSNQPDNVAAVPVKLMRGEDELSLTGSQTAARPGQVVELNLHVLPNLDGYDRQFTLQSQLPANVSLIEGSVKVPAAMQAGLQQQANGFTLTTTHQNTLGKAREYVLSTNATDASCKVPEFGQNDPGYVDLAAFGFEPQWGGQWNDNLAVNLEWYYGEGVKTALFNNFDNASSNTLTLSPMGYLQVDSMPLFFPQHQKMPFQNFPDQMVAPLWRGVGINDAGGDWATLYTPYNVDWWNPSNNSGLSMGFTADGQLIVEWDNARSTEQSYDWEAGETVNIDRSDSYDFEVIYNLNYRFGDGEHEVVMAYNNINFGDEYGFGSIGIQGYDGFRGSFGPASGWIGTSFAADDLKAKLHNKLVVCYDYQGPESSQFDVSFKVRVNADAAGTTQPIALQIARDGLPTELVRHNLAIRGDLKIGAMKDLTVAEDSSINDILVAYSDENSVANVVSVSGAHISAVVHGHEPGDTFDLTPAKDFSGDTLVTVQVADSQTPSDLVSTSFTLHVTPTQDAPMAAVAQSNISVTTGQTVTLDASPSKDVDGDALTYSWSGSGTLSGANSAKATVTGLSAGTYTYTVTVSDGVDQSSSTVKVTVTDPVSEVKPTGSNKGGSMGWFSLLLLPLAVWRRRN